MYNVYTFFFAPSVYIQLPHGRRWFTRFFIGTVPNKMKKQEMAPQNFLPHVRCCCCQHLAR